MQDEITISPNAQRTERISGRFFTVISATAKFIVELDGRKRRVVRAGSKVSDEPFKRISFFETEGVQNDIIFDAGDEEYQGEVQVSGVSNETFDYPFFNSTGTTNVDDVAYTSLPLVVAISGVSYTRKSFHIASRGGNDLGIYTSGGKLLDVLNGNAERTFYFTQDVKLRSIPSSPVAIALYYTLYNTTPQA